MDEKFPEVSNLDYQVNLLNHFKDSNNDEAQQSPDEREVMAHIIGEETNDSISIRDLEYNLYQRSDERWHP